MVAATERAAAPRARASLTTKLLGIAALAAVVGAWQGLSAWHDRHGIFINASESLPNWAFLVEAGRFPDRGDYVLLDPGHDPLTVKHFGIKPSPFAKIAYGIAGDVVSHKGAQVLINGKPVVRMKPLTHDGETLIQGPVGTIPERCIFAGTPHKDGFDSRYAAIGFVCGARVLGVGRPIL